MGSIWEKGCSFVKKTVSYYSQSRGCKGRTQRKEQLQIPFLFVATKMPWELGNVKHSEQKVLVSLLPFKSQNTPQTHSMQGWVQKADTEPVCWEKSRCCFSAATQDELSCPRAGAATVSLSRESRSSCPCSKQSITVQTTNSSFQFVHSCLGRQCNTDCC